jgi:hypothetical protein
MPSKDDERTVGLRAAYGAATQRLRRNHREEFHALYAKEAKDRGLEWSPRLNEEERALKELRALVAAHPFLMDRLGDFTPEPTEETKESE